jgi:glycosyltransferase involved in cell wall biosynthesis
MKSKKVLLIYVEPTPYILGLVSILTRLWPADVDVLFLKENVSQTWALELDPERMSVLPTGLMDALGVIRLRLAAHDYGLAHLAGWAPLLMPAAMVLARYQRMAVTVETDTPLPVGLPLWKRAVKRVFYPLLFSLPHAFLPGGKRQAAYLRHYGVAEERIVPVQMTVDVAAITHYVDGLDAVQRAKIRQDFGLPDEATVFIYVGRMEPHKGLQELLEAFGRLHAGEGAAAALMLVGDGSMRDAMAGNVATDSRIRWLGRLSGTALLDAYAAADVFILASRFEPWGLVVNEAMAAGLPVIATERVGCVDDLVIQDKTGLVVQAVSPDALAGAMESLLQDRTIRDKMARGARSHIAGWTLENEAEIVVDTWKQLLKC